MVTHQSTNIIHPLGIGAQESLGNMPKHLPVKHHRENFLVEFSIIKALCINKSKTATASKE